MWYWHRGGKVKAWEDACNQPDSWQRQANSVDEIGASFAKRIEYRENNKKNLISMDDVYLLFDVCNRA